MDVRSLGFRTDLMVRKLSGSTVTDKGDHLVVRTPDNPTFYWGNFLLLAKPPRGDEARRWLDVFAATFPDAGHIAIGIDGTSGNAGDISAFVEAGLGLEANTVLAASELTAPTGHTECLHITTEDGWNQIGDVRLEVHRDEAEAGDLARYEAFVRRSVAQSRRMSESGHAAWFGALVDGAVRASLGIVSDGRGVARFQMVETHPDHRRRGLATALVTTAGRFAKTEMRAHTLVIVADPAYVAIDLYRKLGFRDAEKQVQLQRPAP